MSGWRSVQVFAVNSEIIVSCCCTLHCNFIMDSSDQTDVFDEFYLSNPYSESPSYSLYRYDFNDVNINGMDSPSLPAARYGVESGRTPTFRYSESNDSSNDEEANDQASQYAYASGSDIDDAYHQSDSDERSDQSGEKDLQTETNGRVSAASGGTNYTSQETAMLPISRKRQSAFEHLVDQLDDELTCSICHDIFQDAQVLPCQHTFCHSCIIPTYAPIILLCPMCRRPFDKTEPDFKMKRLVDIHMYALSEFPERKRAKGEASSMDHRCQLCDKKQFTHFCSRCKKLQCETCLEVHIKLTPCTKENANTIDLLHSGIQAALNTEHQIFTHMLRSFEDGPDILNRTREEAKGKLAQMKADAVAYFEQQEAKFTESFTKKVIKVKQERAKIVQGIKNVVADVQNAQGKDKSAIVASLYALFAIRKKKQELFNTPLTMLTLSYNQFKHGSLNKDLVTVNERRLCISSGVVPLSLAK